MVTAPTCTEAGYTTHTCSRCGDSYTDTPVEALGHDFGEWTQTTAPTCTAAGEETRSCSRCDATETRPVEALGHDYNAVVTAPTCTEAGYTTHTCSRCGDSYTDTPVNALGHDFGEWTQTTAPTCTEAGVETRTCSRCDVTDTRPVAALGHDFGEWTQTTAPTCTAAGEETRSCSRCDATETRPVPATGHNMTEHPAVAATCETAGNSAYWSCDQCNKYFSDAEGNTEIEADSWVIDALNHAWPAADAQEGIAWAWTGNDTDGYTAATLTLTCTRDNSHTHTETVTVTGAAGEGNDLGYTVYTATVSFDNKTYTDTTRTPITYTITYNLDNGALAEGATNPTSYTVESDEITLNNPTKEGYTFAGWTGTDLTEATTEVTIVAGSTGNREYTATWNPVVTFNANFVPEGSTEAATAEQVWTADTTNLTSLADLNALNNNANAFTREGYTFTGWNTAEDGSGTEYADEAEVTITAPMTLYAQWDPEQVVAVTLNVYGGTLVTTGDDAYGDLALEPDQATEPNTYTGTFAPGTEYALPTAAQITKTGYAFGGWYTNEQCTEGNEATAILATASEAQTFWAKWTQLNTFTHSDNFANVDSYLYRVGNNATTPVKLGALFKVDVAGDSGVVANDVKIKVIGRETNSTVYNATRGLEPGSSAHCTYTIQSNWLNSTLQFEGEGPVQIIIKEGDNGAEYTLNLEVVNAKNATTAMSANNTNGNVVLLNSVNGGLTIESGKTLYGNGFEVRDTRNHPSLTAGYVTINNGTADNVRFIGYEPSEQVLTGYQNADYAPAVVVTSSGGNIYNCYFSGGRFALGTTGTTFIKNSVFDGGALANISFAGNLTLEDCETTTSTRGGIVGMGLYCQSNSANLYLVGSFVQHNWLVESEIPSAYRNALRQYYNTDFAYTAANGTKYLNMGVFFVSDTDDFPQTVVEPMIHDLTGRNCGYIQNTMMSHIGTCYTPKGSTGTQSQIEGAAFSPNQYDTIPTDTFDYTTKNYIPNNGGTEYCYYDTGIVYISFEKTTDATTFSWDPMILSVSKLGNELDYTVTMNGTDYTDNMIQFAETGDYTVQYTYTDPFNYDKDTNRYVSRTYTKYVNLSVTAVPPEVVVYHPLFSYKNTWNNASKTVVINNKTYVMPDISSTNANFGSMTIGGQTVYFPIVELEGKNSSNGTYSKGDIYFFAPAFKAINIIDYDQTNGSVQYTYNTSSNSWPHGNSATTMPTNNSNLRSFAGDVFAVKGVSPGNTNAPWLSDCNVDGTNSTKAGAVKKDSTDGLCFVTEKISRDAPKSVTVANQLTEFYYVGNDGIKYYYYIQYNYNQKKYVQGGCFAPGTMITLADGTQKPVENVSANDKLLVWDFFEGKTAQTGIIAVINHGRQTTNSILLRFEDGKEINILEKHDLFCIEENAFVTIYPEDCESYVGKTFVTIAADGTLGETKLLSVDVETVETELYSIITVQHLNAVANGLLTLTPSSKFLTPFEVGDGMQYDTEKMEQDIETYGLMTYDEFLQTIQNEGITEGMFNALGCKYIYIALGKGLASVESIQAIAEVLLNDMVK